MNDFKSTFDDYTNLTEAIEEVNLMIEISKEENNLEFIEDIAKEMNLKQETIMRYFK